MALQEQWRNWPVIMNTELPLSGARGIIYIVCITCGSKFSLASLRLQEILRALKLCLPRYVCRVSSTPSYQAIPRPQVKAVKVGRRDCKFVKVIGGVIVTCGFTVWKPGLSAGRLCRHLYSTMSTGAAFGPMCELRRHMRIIILIFTRQAGL